MVSTRVAAAVLISFPVWLQGVYLVSGWLNQNKVAGGTHYMDGDAALAILHPPTLRTARAPDPSPAPAAPALAGECLLKAINVTNPVHFARHPVWPARGYRSDCDVHAYMEANFQNPTERKAMLATYAVEILAGIIALVRFGLPKRLPELLLFSIVGTSFHFLC